MLNIIPVILAGGEESRLKPLSSESNPKQFLKLSPKPDALSLLQETAKRAMRLYDAKNVIVVAAERYKEITIRQLSEIDKDLCKNILWEPCSRNTAAAISIASIHVAHKSVNPIFCVMPSDHFIEDEAKLIYGLKNSIVAARRGHIVSFGTTPTRIDRNFSYILGGQESSFSDLVAVTSFSKNPSKAQIKMLMNYSKIWWNSGIYLMSTRTFFTEMKKYNSEILRKASDAHSLAIKNEDGYKINNDIYSKISPISIEKAIMEHSKTLLVRDLDVGWMDIGSWQSVWELSQKEGQGTPLENFLDKIASAS